MGRILIISALLVSAYSFADNIKTLGLNFGAPTIKDEQEVDDIQMGEIVYDTTEQIFYGATGTTSSDWVPLNQAPGSSFSTGDIITSIASSKTGWIICDGTQSIGKSGSGATLNGDTYRDLYDLIWSLSGISTTSGHPFVLSSTPGASAEADWNANKTISIDFATNELFVRQKGSSLSLGGYQADAFQGHKHSVSDPGHSHTAAAWTSSSPYGGGAGNLNYSGGTSTATTGLSVQNPTTDGSNGTPRTSSETRPRNVALNYFIKF